MELDETIDECIRQMKSEVDAWITVKNNEDFFGPYNESTKTEVDNNIKKYNQHLDNLSSIRGNLNNGK